MNIILMGLRGSGKSTVGPMLAARLGLEFVELDALSAAAAGFSTPAEVFARAGQAAFRGAEAKALGEVLKRGGQVISLGGGTPTAPGVAEMLAKQKTELRTVYLRAGPETLRARMREKDVASRPSITGGDPLAEVDAVFAERDPLYLSVAWAVVACEGRAMEQTAEDVAALVRTAD